VGYAAPSRGSALTHYVAGSRAASAALIAGFILCVLFIFARLFSAFISGAVSWASSGLRRIFADDCRFGLMIAALGKTVKRLAAMPSWQPC